MHALLSQRDAQPPPLLGRPISASRHAYTGSSVADEVSFVQQKK